MLKPPESARATVCTDSQGLYVQLSDVLICNLSAQVDDFFIHFAPCKDAVLLWPLVFSRFYMDCFQFIKTDDLFHMAGKNKQLKFVGCESQASDLFEEKNETI